MLSNEETRIQKISGAVATIIECVGEDPNREGLAETPMRYARAMLEITRGYSENIEEIVNGALFEEMHDGMIVVKDIEVFSLCEHHLVPFFGTVTIGYIPNGTVIGLSKLARIAEMYCRRFTVQERVTQQIADALMETLTAKGVAVTMKATHCCMTMRGVNKSSCTTVTSAMLGMLRDSHELRMEFYQLSGH